MRKLFVVVATKCDLEDRQITTEQGQALAAKHGESTLCIMYRTLLEEFVWLFA